MQARAKWRTTKGRRKRAVVVAVGGGLGWDDGGVAEELTLDEFGSIIHAHGICCPPLDCNEMSMFITYGGGRDGVVDSYDIYAIIHKTA